MNFPLHISSAQETMDNCAIPSEVLFVAEASPWGELGYKAVSDVFASVFPVLWSPGMPKIDLSGWHGDWIISFKSDLILPRAVLERAKKGAINFHPSPPKYRGLGGYWWALHNGDDTYGVTCHHMNERIDHGEIITTESFPILSVDTVESLKYRAAVHSLDLLKETINKIISEKPLLSCGAEWEHHLYTAKELALAQSAVAMNGGRPIGQPFIKPYDARAALEVLETIHESITELREENVTTSQTDRAFEPKVASA